MMIDSIIMHIQDDLLTYQAMIQQQQKQHMQKIISIFEFINDM